jgi:CRP-like cAMP-binding protein
MVTHNAFQNLIISFAPGERVFTEGEVGTTMFIVQSGRVRLFRAGGGKAVAIAEMEKGDFFGEMSLLEATPRNMSAEAINSVELIEINSTTFDRMIRSNIEIAVRMLRKLSGRLQKAESLLGAQRAAQSGDLAGALPLSTPTAAATPLAAASAARSAKVSVTTVTAPAPAAGAATRAGKTRPATVPVSGAMGTTTSIPAAAPPVAAPAPAATRPGAAASAFPGSLSATRPPAAPAVAASMPAGGAATATSTTTAARPAPPIAPVITARPVVAQGARLVSENGETVFPISQGEALLGRYDPVTETQPEVDLTLIDIKRSVSRRHARISTRDGIYFLTEEVGALNGTFVNGVKLTTGKPAPLTNEDRVSLGTVNLVFRS